MKTLSAKQIEQIKGLTAFTRTNFHGNRKSLGSLAVEEIKEIVSKKYNRRMGNYVAKNGKIIYSYQFKSTPKSCTRQTRDLLNWSNECKGTNYFKIMIEGNTGIYYAHPHYQHSDYNKSRVFDKNEHTIKLMNIFNSIVNKY